MNPERFELFKRLMNTDLCDQSPSIRAALAVPFIDEEFGLNGVSARQAIQIPSITSDFAFTYPLMLYDQLTRASMTDIIDAAENASNVTDFHSKLTPLGRTMVYTHTYAILDFYRFPTDMIPDVDHRVLEDGFKVLHDLVEPVVKIFTPTARIPTVLTYNLPLASEFHSRYSMAWYLCASDLSWTRVLFEAVKSSTFELLSSPLHASLCVAELATQTFFGIYTSGIDALARGKTLTSDQYIILNMIFKLDVDCYNDCASYHKAINVLPDRFFDEMDVICGNVKDVYNAVKRSDYITVSKPSAWG
jgi:hypothetical protein